MAAEPRRLALGCGRDPAHALLLHEFTRAGVGDQVGLAHDLNDVPWPWGDGYFDEITGAGVVEHLRLAPADVLAECARLLVTGGRLYLLFGEDQGAWANRLAATAKRGPWRVAPPADGLPSFDAAKR